jgi:hypothetical protein
MTKLEENIRSFHGLFTGDHVYLKTDPDQRQWIITAIIIQAGGGVMYQLSHDTLSSNHYAVELSKDKDVLKTLL